MIIDRHCYMYTNKDGDTCYYYGATSPKMERNVFIVLIVAVIVIAGSIIFECGRRMTPNPAKKMTPVYASPESHIDDELHLFSLSETTDIELALRAFEKASGICPYIVTTANKHDISLYDSMFNDEQHILLIYYKYNQLDDNLHLNEIRGADTTKYLSYRDYSMLMRQLRNYDNLRDSIVDGFGEMTQLYEPKTNYAMIFPIIFILLVMAAAIVFLNIWYKHYNYDYVELSPEQEAQIREEQAWRQAERERRNAEEFAKEDINKVIDEMDPDDYSNVNPFKPRGEQPPKESD